MNKLLILIPVILISCIQPESNNDLKYWQKDRVQTYNVLYRDLIANHQERIRKDLSLTNSTSHKIDGLLKESEETIAKLTTIEKQLIELNGGVSEYGTFNNASQDLQFQEIFVESGIGSNIEEAIESFSNYISDLGVSTTTLAIDPKTNPWMKYDPNFQGVEFVELHFAKTDIYEAIQAIRFYQIKILLQTDAAIHQLTK